MSWLHRMTHFVFVLHWETFSTCETLSGVANGLVCQNFRCGKHDLVVFRWREEPSFIYGSRFIRKRALLSTVGLKRLLLNQMDEAFHRWIKKVTIKSNGWDWILESRSVWQRRDLIACVRCGGAKLPLWMAELWSAELCLSDLYSGDVFGHGLMLTRWLMLTKTYMESWTCRQGFMWIREGKRGHGLMLTMDSCYQKHNKILTTSYELEHQKLDGLLEK